MDDVNGVAAGKPLVSIVMIAFNQQDWVREAIASLMAQNYANYEIILSDDNSTDNTFAVMEEMATAYTGPHAVRLNRTNANRGTLSHLYEAVKLTRGSLIVVAGGDDVSLSHRVSSLVGLWQETGAAAVFSACTVIDETGNAILEGTVYPDRTVQSYFPKRRAQKIFGAMAAYDRHVFYEIALPEQPIYCEDMFLSLMLHCYRRQIAWTDERLVRYRSHANSLTNSHGTSLSVEESERKAARLQADNANILVLLADAAQHERGKGRQDIDVDLAAVQDMRRYYCYSAKWLASTTYERVSGMLRLRRVEQLRWALPRLFGLPAFLRLKAIQRAAEQRP